MSTATDNNMTTCANCGRGEESTGDLKACTACKVVKYCNRDCQIAHRPEHKKACKERAAKLRDEALFKDPPQNEDCPICFLRLPTLLSGWRHKTCCGKRICSGCIHAVNIIDDEEKCPFCRSPAPIEEEGMKQIQKRVETDDAEAMNGLGYLYWRGSNGLPQDFAKALELWHRAAELGHAGAYNNIGNCYWYGRGVGMDKKKGKHYCELGAIGGFVGARYLLSNIEKNAGNMDKALKHFMIAVGFGHDGSLKQMKQLFMKGHVTKDEYSKALKSYQAYLGEIKSDQRDAAAAYDEGFKYY